jgi:hypothetical protein
VLLIAPAQATVAAPTVAISLGNVPPPRWNGTNATFNFVGQSSEPLDYTCTLSDQPTWHQACSSGLVYTSERFVDEGTYTFTVEATDQDFQSASDSYTWVVDRTPPTLTINSGPADNSVILTNTATYAWSATGIAPTNDAATFSCYLDENPVAGCASPLNLGKLSIGAHTFELHSSDSAGNPAPVQLRHFKVAAPCNVSIQSKVAIRSPKTVAKAGLSPTCALFNRKTAAWSVKNPSGAAASTVSFTTSAPTTTWTLPDSVKPGTYTAKPAGATNTLGEPMAQNTSTAIVRLASHLTLRATRSGKKVTFKVATSTYSPSANKFTPTGKRGAVIQYRTCATCAWKVLKKVKTSSTGKVSFTINQKSVRYYRAVTGNTATIWGVITAGIHR